MYQSAAKLAIMAENGQGYKSALFSSKNKKKIRSIYFLVANAVRKKEVIDKLLLKVGIMKEVKSQIWLARVLVTELLWGRGHIPSSLPFFKRIAQHKKQLSDQLPKSDRESSQGLRTINFNLPERHKD